MVVSSGVDVPWVTVSAGGDPLVKGRKGDVVSFVSVASSVLLLPMVSVCRV